MNSNLRILSPERKTCNYCEVKANFKFDLDFWAHCGLTRCGRLLPIIPFLKNYRICKKTAFGGLNVH
jgi:hypothetical protein